MRLNNDGATFVPQKDSKTGLWFYKVGNKKYGPFNKAVEAKGDFTYRFSKDLPKGGSSRKLTEDDIASLSDAFDDYVDSIPNSSDEYGIGYNSPDDEKEIMRVLRNSKRIFNENENTSKRKKIKKVDEIVKPSRDEVEKTLNNFLSKNKLRITDDMDETIDYILEFFDEEYPPQDAEDAVKHWYRDTKEFFPEVFVKTNRNVKSSQKGFENVVEGTPYDDYHIDTKGMGILDVEHIINEIESRGNQAVLTINTSDGRSWHSHFNAKEWNDLKDSVNGVDDFARNSGKYGKGAAITDVWVTEVAGGSYVSNSRHIKSSYRKNKYNYPDFNEDKISFEENQDENFVVPGEEFPFDIPEDYPDADYEEHEPDVGEFWGYRDETRRKDPMTGYLQNSCSCKRNKAIKSGYYDDTVNHPAGGGTCDYCAKEIEPGDGYENDFESTREAAINELSVALGGRPWMSESQFIRWVMSADDEIDEDYVEDMIEDVIDAAFQDKSGYMCPDCIHTRMKDAAEKWVEENW